MRSAHIDDATQILLSQSHHQRELAMSHYLPIIERSGQCCMFDKHRQTFYWPPIAADVDCAVRNCTSYALNSPNNRHRRKFSYCQEESWSIWLQYISESHLQNCLKQPRHPRHYRLLYQVITKKRRYIKYNSHAQCQSIIESPAHSDGIPSYILIDSHTQLVRKLFL